MSINVTVTGNPISIRRGRMFMTDLDQIKKNERDRLRRLRLEQVRQQSKEISNRLLERARNVAKREWDRFDKDPNSELKKMHQQKIMEIQQKYQEDMEDIGMSHAAACAQLELEKRHTSLREEQQQIHRFNALQRGKEAEQIIQESSKKIDPEQTRVDRMKQTRRTEDLRSSMVAQLPKKHVVEQKNKTPPRKLVVVNKKRYHKRKNGLKTRPSVHKVVVDVHASDDQAPRTCVPVASTTDQSRFNMESVSDSSSSSSGSSSTTSDDSSYFSDTSERQPCKTSERVQMYDHSARHSSTYETPDATVEKLETRNTKPNAREAAEILKSQENASAKLELSKARKLTAAKRGEDARLRDKVRRDYDILLKNLEQLEREERLLKASQTEDNYPKGIHKKNLEARREKTMHRAFKTILNDTCNCRVPITLPPRLEVSKGTIEEGTWDDPPFVQPCQTTTKLSRDEHILEMLTKVERQRRLLLQEFGANLPNDILNTILNTTTEPSRSLSPEIKVVDMSKTIETAVQTLKILPQDKGVQVELTKDEIQPHPVEPKVTIITHQGEITSSSSSLLTDLVIDVEEKEIKVSPKKKRNKKQIPKGVSIRVNKLNKLNKKSSDTSTSFASPPPAKPLLPEAVGYSTPILEMLDSSYGSNIRRIRESVSPVSTPETPSPRTMRLPSNLPHADKFYKILNQQPSASNSQLVEKKYNQTVVDKSPRVLKKYEELQNVCAERIASLNELISKVRNEQRDIDIDLPGDETSLMQLPTPKPMKAELQSIRKIIESIEGIQNQLSRTLEKSQNSNKKAKIINDEKVNINLNRFKIQQKEIVEKLSEEILEDSKNMVPEKDNVTFVPMLAGIPKISRTPSSKPPVSLLSAPYRTPQIETMGHELSTIMEFDTPDTGRLKSPKKNKVWSDEGEEEEEEELESDRNLQDLEKYKLAMAQSLHSLAARSNKQLQNDANELLMKLKDFQIGLPGPSTNKESSTSFSGLSGISEITTSDPSSSGLFKNHSSTEEEMETALKKLRLGWALTTLKKTREASALGSSSNSDGTPVNTARRLLSPNKKQSDTGIPELSDLSSISMRETNKSTEQGLLITKGRTSTPNRKEFSSTSNSSLN